MLTFDAPTHIYRWHGVVLPHVTGVLRPLVDYSQVSALALTTARQEGVAIHKMIELYLTKKLDYLPPWLGPRLKALQKFLRESGFEFAASEEIVFHRRHRYATRLDLRGNMDGRRCVIEAKRSLLAGAVIGLQTAGQAAAVDQDEKTKSDRYSLVLKNNADYSLTAYTDASDYSAFLAALALHNWRVSHSTVAEVAGEYDTV